VVGQIRERLVALLVELDFGDAREGGSTSSGASLVASGLVTERSEGNPEGVDEAGGAEDVGAERADAEELTDNDPRCERGPSVEPERCNEPGRADREPPG
jgi:hypothetical protein